MNTPNETLEPLQREFIDAYLKIARELIKNGDDFTNLVFSVAGETEDEPLEFDLVLKVISK